MGMATMGIMGMVNPMVKVMVRPIHQNIMDLRPMLDMPLKDMGAMAMDILTNMESPNMVTVMLMVRNNSNIT